MRFVAEVSKLLYAERTMGMSRLKTCTRMTPLLHDNLHRSAAHFLRFLEGCNRREHLRLQLKLDS